MSVKGKSNLSLFSSGVHGALEVTIRGEVITEEAVAHGEGCGQCCSCRKRGGGGGGVLGQGDTGPSGKAREIPVYTLPMSVILADWKQSIPLCVPPPVWWHWQQSRTALGAPRSTMSSAPSRGGLA